MAKEKKLEKILRVGIVQGGRIIEERLLRHKEPITVGQSPKNKFMIPSPRVPLTYTLVDLKRGKGKYELCFEKGMLGKVLVGEEVLDLKSIAKRRLAVRKDSRFRFPLSEESRGKVVLGDVTFLFQFVTPPPEVPKLQLPAEAKGAWWRNIDRAMVGIFTLVFLGLGGPGGGLHAWWVQTGRYLAPTQAPKPKIFQTLVTASKVKDPDADKKKEKGDAEKAEKEKGIADEEDKPKDEAPKTEVDKALEDDPTVDETSADDPLADIDMDDPEKAGVDEDAIAAKLAGSMKPEDTPAPNVGTGHNPERAKRLVSNHTVAGLVGSDFGVGVGGVNDNLASGMRKIRDSGSFGEGELGLGGDGVHSDYLEGDESLSRIADQAGAGMGPGGPGTGAGTGGPGNVVAMMRPDIGKPTGGPGSEEVLKGPDKQLEAKKPVKPKTSFKLTSRGGSGFVGGKVDKKAVNKYLRKRQGSLGRCYQAAARRNPNVGGKLTLRIKIDLSGRATAKVVKDKTGDPSIAKCIIGKIRGWSFPKPKGRSVEFKVPFVFRSR
jgi:outer membrane biosynthesis protein TonB